MSSLDMVAVICMMLGCVGWLGEEGTHTLSGDSGDEMPEKDWKGPRDKGAGRVEETIVKGCLQRISKTICDDPAKKARVISGLKGFVLRPMASSCRDVAAHDARSSSSVNDLRDKKNALQGL